MRIDTSNFRFPDAEDITDSDQVTPQMLHDLCIALGASCKHCQTQNPRRAKRAKALHRGENRADVMARAKLRRLALLQAVVEAESQ